MSQKTVFISYSWDTPQHKNWVKKLADTLEEIHEIHVVWDGYDLDSLVDKNRFMEAGIYDADFVLVVATRGYKHKADNRKAGVGVETFMATASHWSRLLEDKKSNMIVVKREADSVPRYLDGHIYVDFTVDGDFRARVVDLTRMISGKPIVERPQKRRTIESLPEQTYDFTQVEQLIRVNHPNRRAIVNSSDGTDFSGANRIKYELWETKSPAISYFLALMNGANIHQTAQHAAGRLLAAEIRPAEITVLRQRSPRPEQDLVAAAFAEKKLQSRIYECTFQEYIWNYCIDETLKKIDPPSSIENYTNQRLTFISNDTREFVSEDSAQDYLIQVLQRPSRVSAHLVVAPGGMGKTSLCLSVAKKLHFRDDLRSSVVLIQAESIKKFIAEHGHVQYRIETVYDIYELYAKYQGHTSIFERSIFDLAVVCGNLIVIIDGLDELMSLFQGLFDVGAFLESLKQLHDQLGSSNILLTTRNNVVAENTDLEILDIERYELLGFDAVSCKQYVSRRLNTYLNSGDMVQKVMKRISNAGFQDSDGRIIPFLADILTTVAEDELREGREQGLDVCNDLTPYPSNNVLTDHIVYSVLRRERTRHDLEILEGEVVELISDLVVDFGKRWQVAEMQNRLNMLYDARCDSILAKLRMNPLLTISINGDVELRYSFLGSYFEILHMLRGLASTSIEPNTIRAFARLNLESEEARDLKRYFSTNRDSVANLLKKIIPKYRAKALSDEVGKNLKSDKANAKGAISSLLNLYFNSQKLSIDLATSELLSLYGLSDDSSTRTMDGLFIKGAFPPINFSNLIVTNSRFVGYKNFLVGRFENTKFMYSVFEDCANYDVASKSIFPSTLDHTCDAGNLREIFALAKASKDDEKIMLESELSRFLHSFFKSGRFVDNKKPHIKFSNKVSGLAPERFDRLIANEYFQLAKSKPTDDFYEVTQSFKPSVRRFLTDGYPDMKIRKLIVTLQ